jgi:hypothetical protein
MESHRNGHRLTPVSRRKQAGITALGFLFLAAVFGILGYAVIRIVPLYMQNMRLSTVLDDISTEMQTQNKTAGSIRIELLKRFSIEGIRIPREDVTIKQVNGGYQVRIQHESRTPFLADIWFLVAFDKQVEIKR